MPVKSALLTLRVPSGWPFRPLLTGARSGILCSPRRNGEKNAVASSPNLEFFRLRMDCQVLKDGITWTWRTGASTPIRHWPQLTGVQLIMANPYIAFFLYLLKRLDRQLRCLNTLLAQSSVVYSHLSESWTSLYIVQALWEKSKKKL